jgi:LuxR family maltose regulon positive regulatory protein
MDEGLRQGRKLTLLSAPAGFGKTTLLTEWFYGQGEVGRGGIGRGGANLPRRSVAWLALDEGDNDPVRFWRYGVAALQTVYDDVGAGMWGALQAAQTAPLPMEALVTILINEVSAKPERLIWVLDDYHVIETQSIHAALTFLLDHLPPNLHLVIATRADPPLPVARLKARNRLTDLRQEDLRFTLPEVAAFLKRTVGRELDREQVAALEERTEGWIAGLQLAALSLQDRNAAQAEAFIQAFTGDDRHVVDYLLEEVLRRQPAAIQHFLLHTALLNRLSAPLCDAVLKAGALDKPDSQSLLERLDQANLFLVPLDNRREWYRYHRLFADLLRYRLQREHPEAVPDLHRRASRWYEAAGDPEEAVHHALAIPDFSRAADVIEQYGVAMVGGSRLATYLGWVHRLPEDVIHARPYLCAATGWAYVLTGQVEKAERVVQAGEAALVGWQETYVVPEGRSIVPDEVRGHLTAIRAYRARLQGDEAGVIAWSEQALAQLPDDAFTARCVVALNLGILRLESGDPDAALPALEEALDMALRSGENIFVAISALSLQGSIAVMQGRLGAAQGLYRRAVDLGSPEGASLPIPAVGMGHLGLANVHYERYELPAAVQHLEEAGALAEQIGHREALMGVYVMRAAVALLAGDWPEAEAQLEQARALVRTEKVLLHASSDWVAVSGKLHLARGDLDAAGALVRSRDLSEQDLAAESPGLGTRLPEYLLLARLRLARGRREAAGRLLQKLLAAAASARLVDLQIEVLAVLALAQQAQGEEAGALLSLERSLKLAAPGGFVRPFVEAGEPMAQLLRRAVAQGRQVAYASRLLSEHWGRTPDAGVHDFYEPLTEREAQVLRLLAAGLSSTEVAEELVLAVSTVRSYIKTIYSKLDVHSREEALTRARQLNLL